MLKVTAWLSSPLLGDPPYLDSILEFEMSQRLGLAEKIRRDQPCPPASSIHIPMLRRTIGGLSVACCSAPIYSVDADGVEHVTKRLAVEYADLLAPEKRRQAAIGNSTLKSYRLPMRRRVVDRVVWFCEGHRRPVLQLLRSVHSLGKKRSMGYGRVEEWTAETVDGDYYWYAPSDSGLVLMRVLPWCDELPTDLIGYRRWFGACQPPMFHPDRFTEIVVPC